MKILLLAIAIAFPSVAVADEWKDENRMMSVKNDVAGGFLFTGADGVSIHCDVSDWPIDSPIGTMTCTGNREIKFELNDKRTMTFNGVRLSKDY